MSRRRRRPDRPPVDVDGTLYPTLDLHGLSAEEATRAASRFLAEQRSRGEVIARLITGRGLHSPGLPVLPGAIEELLRSLSGATVRGFEREPGGGVYRVRLNPPDGPPAPAATRPLTRDPEVVRQAEEALEELGIKPTPELVNAEVARILEEREIGSE